MIRDEGIFKVPGSRNGNRHCACALLLIPSFLQLLVLDPETAKFPVRREFLHLAPLADVKLSYASPGFFWPWNMLCCRAATRAADWPMA